MKKTIYIHIGRPKVGSTAIQRFLKINRDELLKDGFLYPVSGEKQNASHQLAAVLQGGEKPANLPSADILYGELISEVENSPANNCIMSSENFYFVKPKRVAAMLYKKFDVRIICYVRRQDEVLSSSYIQELRDDSLDEDERDDIDRYLNRPDRLSFLDYKTTMDQWADVFGVENVIVRVYEEGQLKGDLFDDVLDAIGLRITAAYSKPEKRVNSTPSSDVLELIRQVNNYPAPILVRKQIKNRLVEISESMGYSNRFDATRIFSIEQKKAVLARFSKSNAATARKYLNRKDGRLFYHDIPADDVEKSQQVSGLENLDFERTTKIWLGMIAYQQEEFNRLQMQINILKKHISSMN